MRHDEVRSYIERDAFANRLGATIEALEPGSCRASLTVAETMVNFHSATHGGVIFGLADVALAGASKASG